MTDISKYRNVSLTHEVPMQHTREDYPRQLHVPHEVKVVY